MANEQEDFGEIQLIDGDARSAEHPDTFKMPPRSERLTLHVGSVVKIGLEFERGPGERFWVEITDVPTDGTTFKGKVLNRLINFDVKGEIPFGIEHILAIYDK